MMLDPDPSMYLLLPLCLRASLVQQATLGTRVGSRPCVVYNSNHREHNNEKTKVPVARVCGTLLFVPPPAAAAAAVGCLGPASNVLYSSWESVVQSLCSSNHGEHGDEGIILVARFRGTLVLAPPAAAAAAAAAAVRDCCPCCYY